MNPVNVLIVSNLYPPHYIGGYELGCKDIVDGLKSRGHTVRVLTTWYGLESQQEDGIVFRLMCPPQAWDKFVTVTPRQMLEREWNHQTSLLRLCREFRPDIVYFFNLGHLSKALMFQPQRLGIPYAFCISDPWLETWDHDIGFTYWQSRHSGSLLKRAAFGLLSTFGLFPFNAPISFDNAHYTSEALRRQSLTAGIPVEKAKVIHWGIDCNRFVFNRNVTKPRNLLYVGQLVPHKGVHTLLEAFRLLTEGGKHQRIRLTIVGGTVINDYKNKLQRYIDAHGLNDSVVLTGALPRSELPKTYSKHDILVFPSVWNEPFSITLIEAMASGLAVIGTNTGGSVEILRDNVNGLVFEKENSYHCARQMERLLNDEVLYHQIRTQARECVELQFNLTEMLDKVEAELVRGALQSVRQVACRQ